MDKDKKDKLDYSKLNGMFGLGNKILKVMFILMIILISWVGLMIVRELEIKDAVLSFLKILTPLFIGLIIAWLFNPFVEKLKKHGIKRIFGVIIAYVLLVGGIVLLLGSIIPILYDQIIDFVDTIPGLFDTLEKWLNNFLTKLEGIEGLDIETTKENLMLQLEDFGSNLYSSLPAFILNIGKAIISGFGTFLIGLVIGFFLLLGFDNVGETLIMYLPKNWREDAEQLFDGINTSLRSYVTGALFDALLIFVVCSIAFGFIGLKAPFLFAIFCAITNIIPYVGPYIGAVPALIVAFSMSPAIGFMVLIAIVIIQAIEGNFIQAVIMSKTTKLHPVTIIIGLLIFGHYWGILGMVFSTPLIASLKIVINFIDNKFHILNYVDEEEVNE
jgi:Predicted permease